MQVGYEFGYNYLPYLAKQHREKELMTKDTNITTIKLCVKGKTVFHLHDV